MGIRDGELSWVKRPTVPCGISDIRRAGEGVAEQEPESSGSKKETDRGIGQTEKIVL